MTEGGRDDVAGLDSFADAGAASDSRLRVPGFEDFERCFDGLVVRGDHTFVLLNQRGDADALWGAEGVVRGSAMFARIYLAAMQVIAVWGLAA